jgi:hypothetical protein
MATTRRVCCRVADALSHVHHVAVHVDLESPSTHLSLLLAHSPYLPCPSHFLALSSRTWSRHGSHREALLTSLPAALSRHSHSRVNRRLRLVVLHPTRALAAGQRRRRAGAASTAAGEPLLRVAPPPRATLRQAVATRGCASASSCFPLLGLVPHR